LVAPTKTRTVNFVDNGAKSSSTPRKLSTRRLPSVRENIDKSAMSSSRRRPSGSRE
jgi:hypothetical protein